MSRAFENGGLDPLIALVDQPYVVKYLKETGTELNLYKEFYVDKEFAMGQENANPILRYCFLDEVAYSLKGGI